MKEPRHDPRLANPWVAHIRELDFRRTRVSLATAHDLFSSAAVDVGTSRLLRALTKKGTPLAQERGRPLRVLDLGCGIGTLGIAVARAMPCGTAQVVLTDRDRLAVAVSRENCRRNGLDPRGDTARVLDAGFGYEPVRKAAEQPFDLIVANVPAKVGKDGLRELLFGAGALLAPGGVVAFVHVTPLTRVIDALLVEFVRARGSVETVLESIGKEHRALLWRFPSGLPQKEPAARFAPWLRDDAPARIRLADLPPYPHVAVRDVAEFDTMNFRTPLVVRLVQQVRPDEGVGDRMLVVNPDHGFLAALLARRSGPASLSLIGRDTLAEAVARTNLTAALNAWRLVDDVALAQPETLPDTPWLPAPAGDADSGFDLITGHLDWKEGSRAHVHTLAAFRDALRKSGDLVLGVDAGKLENLKKLAREAGLAYGKVARRKGQAAVCLRRA